MNAIMARWNRNSLAAPGMSKKPNPSSLIAASAGGRPEQ
jgi:hypothetical protein